MSDQDENQTEELDSENTGLEGTEDDADTTSEDDADTTSEDDADTTSEDDGPATVVLTCRNQLSDGEGQTFFPSKPVKVEKITSWMRSQIDAGLMEIVK